jgi:hypothetical protein
MQRTASQCLLARLDSMWLPSVHAFVLRGTLRIMLTEHWLVFVLISLRPVHSMKGLHDSVKRMLDSYATMLLLAFTRRPDGPVNHTFVFPCLHKLYDC